MVEAGVRNFEKEKSNGRLLIFVGPEGSGKSTQAKKLSEELNIPYVSTGDIIRERAKNDTSEIGEKCREMLSAHSYLDPQTLLSLLEYRLSKKDIERGAVLDGALRTPEEVDNFESMLDKAKRADKEITVISLRTAGWESVERLLKRERHDDHAEAILNRLSNYYNKLGERTSRIRNKWKFIQVLSNGLAEDRDSKWEQIENTHKKIMRILENE